MKSEISNQELKIRQLKSCFLFPVLCFLLAISCFLFSASSLAGGSLKQALAVSASGMKAESERIKVITENIANSDTTGLSPTQEPYRRKTVFFNQIIDKKTGTKLVNVKRIGVDNSDFKIVYQPNHPAADEAGYVKYPNVDRMMESMDMREAQRNYEANITAIEITKGMMDRSLDLMR
ncbi:MAG TPA: flagellar basal body rod protein FlgC [Alphaproteobacteria bacterium]|nr:flagellar basal body rod protein FlgC [Alphaproteobacteria bacterium]